VQAFGENVLFEVADPPCWWDVYEEPFVVGYWFWEWLVKVKGKLGLKVREENTPNRHPSGICSFPHCGLDSSIVVDCSTSC